MCGPCLESMRGFFGIDETAVNEAIRRGFYRPFSLVEGLDRALGRLDQAEIKELPRRGRLLPL